MKKLLTPNVRRWLYVVALASFPVLIHYGLVEIEAAPLWLGFIVALLNVKSDEPTDRYHPED